MNAKGDDWAILLVTIILALLLPWWAILLLPLFPVLLIILLCGIFR